jgi:hypothetical protein
MEKETVVMFRPAGPGEIELVAASGYKIWPPRLPQQPIFYPVTNEEYAREITMQWDVKESYVGYVTKFHVRKSFIARYAIHQVGGANHTEWWIPDEDLDELNDNIIGQIEIVGEYT